MWDVDAFEAINGYPAWARELEDEGDIIRHIERGHLVPINIRSDGAFSIAVRASADEMPT